jgi:SynChlorMet cassette radical SAM/SPASM protein ScmE
MKVKPLSAPEKVFLALTSECNLRCRHCNVFPFRESPRDFTTTQWKAFFQRLEEMKVFSVWLSGGELMCREDIFTLLDDLHARPLRIDGINTNGTLVDRDAARRLGGYRKLSSVQVGLDGASPKTHDKLRGPGVFEKAVRGIENLVNADIVTTIFCVVTRFNNHELKAIATLARDLGVRAITMSMLLPQGNALHYASEMALSKAEWHETVEEAGRLSKEFPGLVGGPLVDMHRMFLDFEKRLSDLTTWEEPFLSGCKTGVTECTVMSDGRVLPCDRLQDVVAGNLNELDFAEIWHNSPVFKEFRGRFEVLLADLPHCRNCDYRPLCTGGCPAIPFYTEGTLLARDPYSCYRFFKEAKP